MRKVEEEIAKAFYRTNILSIKDSCDLAQLAVTLYENSEYKPFMRISESNTHTQQLLRGEAQ